MTTAREILTDAFGRVAALVPATVEGLSADELRWRPDPDANPIGWLVWHLSRVQDDHLVGVAGHEGGDAQIYLSGGWADRLALPYHVGSIGYGHTSEEVGAFAVSDPALLTGYHAAVHTMTLEVLAGLDDAGFARVVDPRFDPPVTAATRLVSVVNDITQHVGQAAYVRGLLERR